MKCVLTGQNKARSSFHAAGIVDLEVCNAIEGSGRVKPHGRSGRSRSGVGKPKAGCEAMLPLEESEGAHLLARVEIDIFAVENDVHDIVIELTECKVAGVEDSSVAIDDLHRVNPQSRSPRKGDIQKSDIVRGSAFLEPHILGTLDFFQVL